ncbi:MAG: DUF2336 domain-containing protein [Xanthobacteraceae bacterium]
MPSSLSLIDDLQETLTSGSGAQRADILRRVTDLFLHGKDVYSEEHVTVFDDVMCHLIEKIERDALIRLSTKLAPVENAPKRTVHQLASSDDIAISGPLIERSQVLGDDFLVDLARSKSQQHLAAIAKRSSIAEKVTDVLVDRGNNEVTLKVAGNQGARFSQSAFRKVAEKAETDANLAANFIARSDVPAEVFQDLLRKATEVVKRKLLKDADPPTRLKITRTLAEIASEVSRERAQMEKSARSATSLAHLDTARLKSRVSELAQAGKRKETIDALATLSKLPVATIKTLLRQGAQDGLLILCKSVGLGWPDVKSVLTGIVGVTSERDLKQAFDSYVRLAPENANRVIRFVKSCKTLSKSELQRML